MMDVLTPRQVEEQAKALYQSGDYPMATKSFAEAASAYLTAGDTLMSAEMKNNISVALLRNKQPADAYDAAFGTDLVFSEAGDHRREGIALANQASALEALKRYKEAIDHYTRAGIALKIAGEADFHLEVMQLLSALYLRRFKLFDAIISLQSGLAAIQNPTAKQRFMKKLLFFRL